MLIAYIFNGVRSRVTNLTRSVVKAVQLAVSTVPQVALTVGAGEAVDARAPVATMTVVVTRSAVLTWLIRRTEVEICQSTAVASSPACDPQ